MTEALDDGKRVVGGDERLRAHREGRRGEDGIERTELGVALEEAKALSQVVFLAGQASAPEFMPVTVNLALPDNEPHPTRTR